MDRARDPTLLQGLQCKLFLCAFIYLSWFTSRVVALQQGLNLAYEVYLNIKFLLIHLCYHFYAPKPNSGNPVKTFEKKL